MNLRWLCVFWLWLAAGPPVAAERVATIATPILPSTVINPYQGVTLPSIFSTLAVFDPLAVIGGDGRLRPRLAKSWTSDEAKVWRISLEPGVEFSNGRPVDAAAVVASVAHMQTKVGRAETIGASLVQIESIRAVSDLEVDVILKERDAMFPSRLALWKIPEPNGWPRALNDGIAAESRGSGPFMFAEVADNRLVLVANPKARHPPAVDRLVFIELPDQTARMQAVLAGSADLALQMGIENRAPIEAGGGHFVPRRTNMLRYVAFAAEHFKGSPSPILKPEVRRALNYAVDKRAIIDGLLAGAVAPVAQLVFPGAPGHDPALEPYPYDPDRARRMLSEAGHGDGIDLTLRFAGSGSDDTSVVQQIVADLKRVGVAVTIRPATQVQMTPLLFNAQLEAELFVNFVRGLDPLGDYRFRSCRGLTAGKPFFCSAETLAAVDRARGATSYDAAVEALKGAIRSEYDDPPGIFLWDSPAFDGFGPRLPPPEGYGLDYDFLAADALALK